jgi:conjugative transfer region lipoprotein (TIGR03751 family)
MHPMYALVKRFALLPLALAMAACATTSEEVIPKTGPTMLEIYRAHQLGATLPAPGSGSATPGAAPSAAATAVAKSSAAPAAPLYLDAAVGASTAGYARDESSVLTQRFARLPNPDLVMYVPPHLGASGAPVPGYVTVFPMYERVEYAMPGEVPPSRQRLGE